MGCGPLSNEIIRKTTGLHLRNRVRHMIKIKDGILVGEDELSFTFSRSSKPGGQNVNKISSRVTLLFDVANSPSLSAEHKHQIMTRFINHHC